MRNLHRLALGATFALLTAGTALNGTASANWVGVPLAQAAAELGYAYSYLGPEDAVQLGRPGVTILVRPGERLFDVNDRTEAMDGPAPRFERNDLYISEQFVARLRAIAAQHPLDSGSGSLVSARHSTSVMANPSGPITALTVNQIPGTEQVDVTGKAPAPNVPITLTLVSTMSVDIPNVVLTRRQVFSDTDGRFHAKVSVTPGNLRGALLTMVASSVPGVASASIRFEMKAPNAGLTIPMEQPERSVR